MLKAILVFGTRGDLFVAIKTALTADTMGLTKGAAVAAGADGGSGQCIVCTPVIFATYGCSSFGTCHFTGLLTKIHAERAC